MKKKLSILMAGTMAATSVLGASSIAYADTSSLSVNRISGKDRYETCANISKNKFKSSETVIIASGEVYPDALSSGVLSIKHNAPLLLVKENEIPKSIKDEINRLGAKKVILVGGENSISKKVYNELSSGRQVERIAGEDRYETSLDVAKKVGLKDSILVNGQNFPDALVANSLAAKLNKNIVLTNGKTLSEKQLKFINQSSKNIILGGTNSMSLEGVKAERVAGEDRYKTAVEVANKYFKDSKNAIFASGTVFADALSAVSLFEKLKQPILLVDDNNSAKSVKKYLDGKSRTSVTVVGGENSIPQSILDTIKDKPSSGGYSGGGGGSSHKPKWVEKLADGEFYGSGKGYKSECRCGGGKKNIEVKLTVKDHNIENIEITKFMDDHAEKNDPKHNYAADEMTQKYLERVKEEIKKDNSTGDLFSRLKKCAITPVGEKDVDVASGATYSSMGMIEAIDNAIEQSIREYNNKKDNSKDIILIKKPRGNVRIGDTLDVNQFSMLKRFWETPEELEAGKESALNKIFEGKDFEKNGIKAEIVTNYYDDEKSKRFPMKDGKLVVTEEMVYEGLIKKAKNPCLMISVVFTDTKTGKMTVYEGMVDDFKTGAYTGTGKGYATEVLDQNDKNYEVEVKFDGRDIEDIKIAKYGDDNKFKKEVDDYLKEITPSIKETKKVEAQLEKVYKEFAKADENIEEVYAKLAVLDAVNDAITRAANINRYGEDKVNTKDLLIAKSPKTELKLGDNIKLGEFAVERTFWNTELNENQLIETKDFSKNYIMVRIIADYYANPHPVMPGEVTEEMLTELNGEKYLVLNFYDRLTRKSSMYFWKVDTEVAPTPDPEKPEVKSEFEAGHYEGIGNSYLARKKGNSSKKINVSVDIDKDGKLTDVKIDKYVDTIGPTHRGNFKEIFEKFKDEITPMIIEKQSVTEAVKAWSKDENKTIEDVTTGATHTSRGYLEGVEDALNNSRLKKSTGEESEVLSYTVTKHPGRFIMNGETVDLSDLEVTVLNRDGKEEVIPFADFEKNGIVVESPIQNGDEATGKDFYLTVKNEKANKKAFLRIKVVKPNSNEEWVDGTYEVENVAVEVKDHAISNITANNLKDDTFFNYVKDRVSGAKESKVVDGKKVKVEAIDNVISDMEAYKAKDNKMAGSYEYKVFNDGREDNEKLLQTIKKAIESIKIGEEETGLKFKDGSHDVEAKGYSSLKRKQENKENKFNVVIKDNQISKITTTQFNDVDAGMGYEANFESARKNLNNKLTEIYNGTEEDKNQAVVNYLEEIKEKIDFNVNAELEYKKGKDITDVTSGATFTTKSMVDSLLELISSFKK